MFRPNPSLVTAEHYARVRNLGTGDVVAAITENRVTPKGVKIGFDDTPRTWDENFSHYLLMSNATISPRAPLPAK